MLIKQTRPLRLFRGPSVLWGIPGQLAGSSRHWEPWLTGGWTRWLSEGAEGLSGWRGLATEVCRHFNTRKSFLNTSHQLLNEGNELPILGVKRTDTWGSLKYFVERRMNEFCDCFHFQDSEFLWYKTSLSQFSCPPTPAISFQAKASLSY